MFFCSSKYDQIVVALLVHVVNTNIKLDLFNLSISLFWQRKGLTINNNNNNNNGIYIALIHRCSKRLMMLRGTQINYMLSKVMWLSYYPAPNWLLFQKQFSASWNQWLPNDMYTEHITVRKTSLLIALFPICDALIEICLLSAWCLLSWEAEDHSTWWA